METTAIHFLRLRQTLRIYSTSSSGDAHLLTAHLSAGRFSFCSHCDCAGANAPIAEPPTAYSCFPFPICFCCLRPFWSPAIDGRQRDREMLGLPDPYKQKICHASSEPYVVLPLSR
jgi:hypothetical protein